jgi:putative transposase
VDGHGVPLSLVVSGANVHDVKLLAETLDRRVVSPAHSCRQNLCADAGYLGWRAREEVTRRGFRPHIRQWRQEMGPSRRYPARRWVVERTHSWFNRFRKILVSFEKTERSYVGLLSLAAALICWRKTIFIYG